MLRTTLKLILLGHLFLAISCGESRPPIQISFQESSHPTDSEAITVNSEFTSIYQNLKQRMDEQNQVLLKFNDKRSQLEQDHLGVVSIEKELPTLLSPDLYASVVIDLYEQIDKRDNLIKLLTDETTAINSSLEALSIESQNLKAFSRQEEVDDLSITIAQLNELEIKLNTLNKQWQNSVEGFTNLLTTITAFTDEINTILTKAEIYRASNFIFDPNEPVHFSSVCSKGFLSEITGREGRLVDQIILSCNGTLQTPVGGNGGNSIESPINCGEGFIAKGIFGSSGNSLDSFGLICAPKSNIDGAEVIQTNVLGNIAGGDPFAFYCPARTVLVGIAGSLDSPNGFLSRAFPVCKKL